MKGAEQSYQQQPGDARRASEAMQQEHVWGYVCSTIALNAAQGFSNALLPLTLNKLANL